jgi:hypothetical protein
MSYNKIVSQLKNFRDLIYQDCFVQHSTDKNYYSLNQLEAYALGQKEIEFVLEDILKSINAKEFRSRKESINPCAIYLLRKNHEEKGRFLSDEAIENLFPSNVKSQIEHLLLYPRQRNDFNPLYSFYDFGELHEDIKKLFDQELKHLTTLCKENKGKINQYSFKDEIVGEVLTVSDLYQYWKYISRNEENQRKYYVTGLNWDIFKIKARRQITEDHSYPSNNYLLRALGQSSFNYTTPKQQPKPQKPLDKYSSLEEEEVHSILSQLNESKNLKKKVEEKESELKAKQEEIQILKGKLQVAQLEEEAINNSINSLSGEGDSIMENIVNELNGILKTDKIESTDE